MKDGSRSAIAAQQASRPPATAAATMATAAALLLRPSLAFVVTGSQKCANRTSPPLAVLKDPSGIDGPSPSARPPTLSSRGLLPLDPATQARAQSRADVIFAKPSRRTTPSRPPPAGTAKRFAGRPAKPAARRNTGAEGSSVYGPSSLQRRSFQLQSSLPSPASAPTGQRTKGQWLERLSSLSNAASLLCVVDCTLLPVATVVLPLLGIAAGPSGAELFHAIGHAVAIFFVMPVGCLAAATNYLSHRRLSLTLPALAGLTLVYLANASHTGPFLSHLPHDLLHSLHCGTFLHRATNIAGCALLLASNFLARRWQEANDVACLGGKFCGRADCRTEEEAESFFRWEQPGM